MMKLEAFLKQAQPDMMMDPSMIGMDPSMMGMGALPPPDMGTPPPPPGAPQPPSPEEVMMMMGQGGLPPDMMAPEEGTDQIIEKQVNVIDNLSQTVRDLVDMSQATGSGLDDTADNVAASIVGSGLLDGVPTEELPGLEEEEEAPLI